MNRGISAWALYSAMVIMVVSVGLMDASYKTVSRVSLFATSIARSACYMTFKTAVNNGASRCMRAPSRSMSGKVHFSVVNVSSGLAEYRLDQVVRGVIDTQQEFLKELEQLKKRVSPIIHDHGVAHAVDHFSAAVPAQVYVSFCARYIEHFAALSMVFDKYVQEKNAGIVVDTHAGVLRALVEDTKVRHIDDEQMVLFCDTLLQKTIKGMQSDLIEYEQLYQAHRAPIDRFFSEYNLMRDELKQVR